MNEKYNCALKWKWWPWTQKRNSKFIEMWPVCELAAESAVCSILKWMSVCRAMIAFQSKIKSIHYSASAPNPTPYRHPPTPSSSTIPRAFQQLRFRSPRIGFHVEHVLFKRQIDNIKCDTQWATEYWILNFQYWVGLNRRLVFCFWFMFVVQIYSTLLFLKFSSFSSISLLLSSLFSFLFLPSKDLSFLLLFFLGFFFGISFLFIF